MGFIPTGGCGGVETTEVFDLGQSIIFDQAENRLHTEKELLVWFVYQRLKRSSAEVRKSHDEEFATVFERVK